VCPIKEDNAFVIYTIFDWPRGETVPVYMVGSKINIGFGTESKIHFLSTVLETGCFPVLIENVIIVVWKKI